MSEEPSDFVSDSIKRHITLVVPGGIALGAYYAGAISQIGYFLAKWDEQRRNGHPELPEIHLDVISGASAGALTGAMLFQFIGTNYYETSKENEDKNLDERAQIWIRKNFDTWCGDKLSMGSLLSSGAKRTSVLNPTPIEELASEALQTCDIKLPDGQGRLIYTCTLTGLDPVHYKLEMEGSPSIFGIRPTKQTDMSGRTRRDWATFRIHRYSGVYPSKNLLHKSANYIFEEIASDIGGFPDKNQLDVLWNRLTWFSMASGAFPFAWNPIQVERSTRYYPDVRYGTEGFREFTYSDGGIIDNMPLDRACKVLRDYSNMEGGDQSGLFEDRTYIFISTDLANSEVKMRTDYSRPNLKSPARNPRFRQGPLAGALFESVREQSFFDDLRDAKRVNEQLQNRERFLWPKFAEYSALLPHAKLRSECKHMREDVYNLIVSKVSASSRKHVKTKFRHTIRQFSSRESVRKIGASFKMDRLRYYHFLLSIVLNDTVHDNAQKHELNVAQVRAIKPLHAAFMGNFGGFIDQNYMRRDFIIGMESAGKWLRDWADDPDLWDKVIADREIWEQLTLNPLPELPANEFPRGYSAVPADVRTMFEEDVSSALKRYFAAIPKVEACVLYGGITLSVSALTLLVISAAKIVPLLTVAGAFAWLLLFCAGIGLLLIYFKYLRNPGQAILKAFNKATTKQIEQIALPTRSAQKIEPTILE